MSSWFSEGTVSVQNGSPTVTGVGTKFSNCRAGDMFVGPDQGIYQVINPASDTSLAISPAYRGPAVGGAGYGIVPVNGYPKALADAVNKMVQQWGATLAGLGSVSTESVVPVTKGGTGGTDPDSARNNLGLGAVAVESILPIAKGGTGATTAAQGIVSLGGIPSGVSSDTSGTTFRSGGLPTFAGATDVNNRAGSLIIQNGGNNAAAAAVTFVREGLFGAHFGLNTDNNLSVGGWSMGANAYVIYHAGNTTRAADGTLKAI